jgi:cell wall-associated NlpC family hydrolase
MVLVRLAIFLLIAGFAAGCATSAARPKPFPGAPDAPSPSAPPEVPAPTPDTPSPPSSTAEPPAPIFDARVVVQTALELRGVPYRNGGTDPSGFDCSGLVQYAFAQHGIALPREVREQYQFGEEVRLAGIEAGDLLFFRTSGDSASHVGIAIGGDEFVHAPSARGVVRVERFSAPYWANRIVGVKRILDSRI